MTKTSTPIYFTTSHATAIPLMQAAYQGTTALALGYIDTPNQGNRLPDDVLWCADNGCFTGVTKGNWSQTKWWNFLEKNAYAADRCAFATAPDVVHLVDVGRPDGKLMPVGDAVATLARSRPWFAKIRELGYKVAFIAQDGWELIADQVPWDEFDVLFIGGSNEFKLGPAGARAIAEAKAHGKWVHLGRVNSALRMSIAEKLGVDSADGSYLCQGARSGGVNINLEKMLSWLGDHDTVSAALDQIGYDEVDVYSKSGHRYIGLSLATDAELPVAA